MRRARWPAMESQVAKPTCPGIWGWHSVSTGSEWPQKIAKSSLFLNHSIYISIYFYHLMAIVFYAPTYQTRKKMVPKFPKVPVRMILNDRDMIGLNSPDVGRFFFFFECVQRGRLWSLHWPNLERPEEVLPNAGAGGILVWHGNIWVPSTFSG